jgi:hypothetical protein
MPKPKNPSDVLQSLLNATDSAQRKSKLTAIHALCDARYQAGEHDFSIPGIGRLCESENLLNGRGLFNKGAEAYRDLIGAWAAYADPIPSDELGQLSDKHPEVVLRKILARGGRSDKQRNLRLLNDLCRKQHAAGALEFSFGSIGQLCENEGILRRASLKNPEFDDHRAIISAWDAFARPWYNAESQAAETAKRVQKAHDLELTWVARDHPELADWRSLAVEWLKGEKAGLGYRVAALTAFFGVYLLHPAVPKQPKDTLARGATLPDFRETACPSSKASVSYNNCIHEMIEWVLLKDFSLLTDDGSRVVSPAFRNPVSYLKNTGGAYVPDESVRSPLPYGYIDELRHILAAGPHFKDWEFAQTALGADIGEKGAPGRDWFDVTEARVDRDDPDCVLRVRTRTGKNNRTQNVLQMWSPVRWMALMVKLLLPLRTTQVRLLDSGEFDTWVFADGQWSLNKRELTHGKKRGQRKQGVFRRQQNQLDGSKVDVALYINTNKTADKVKDGPDKGYVVPWYVSHELTGNVYYWLEKLRNWQAKYNPIDRAASWAELDARHIKLKSKEQLASYPDTCFLFRQPEAADGETHLPVTDGILASAWCNLLMELQSRLAARGETHADGSPIQLAYVDGSGRFSTPFPLHSLRVSLVTALALDGEVPFPILQKLVGHSRLLMTLYYTKPGAERINAVLTDAAARLSANKEKSISEFLLNAEYGKLVETAICNSQATFAATVPEHPASRNAAGWMLMHHGLCLVGGNTSEVEDNNKIGGCYNGGSNLGSESTPKFGPTPGGSRNCIRCRWFVTEPHFLPALAAHFNAIAYHFDEARNKSMDAERGLQEIKRQKARMEAAPDGPPFAQHQELRQAERLRETNMKRFSDLAEDLVACWRLVERCQVLLNSPQGEGGQQLLVQGAVHHVQAIFEETESELLQLSGVCESLQLYPDLDADKAVIRRSQLLDSALYNEGLPPVFMQLSEREQLLAGNAFMQRLALKVNPANPADAQRQVIALMDAGKRLGEHLGIELDESFLPGLPTRTNQKKYIHIAKIDDECTS